MNSPFSMRNKFDLNSLKMILDANPDLSIEGWWWNDPDEGSPYSPARFPVSRAMFLQPEYQEQIQTVCEYFIHFSPEHYGSYGLKHYIENWGRETGYSTYVSNGCAIAGAMLSGYDPVREKNSPNCRFIRQKGARNV